MTHPHKHPPSHHLMFFLQVALLSLMTLLDYIIDNTNKYAEKIASMRHTKHAPYRNWQPVMKEDI